MEYAGKMKPAKVLAGNMEQVDRHSQEDDVLRRLEKRMDQLCAQMSSTQRQVRELTEAFHASQRQVR